MQDSIWFRTLPSELSDLLRNSDTLPERADVVIVGSGMIGVSTAYYLTQAGVKNICLLDRGTALGEASGANAGGLWFGQQSPELGPISVLAKASSHLYDELSQALEFEFTKTGLLELLHGAEQADHAKERVRAVRDSGFRAELVSGKHARSIEPGLALTPEAALFYPDEAHVHPTRLAAALVGDLRQKGVRFCFNTEVTHLNHSVETNRGAISAGNTVIASGAWTPLVTQTLGWQPPIKPMRGTLLALEPLPPVLQHALIGEKYYYWQLREGQIVAGGSVDDVGFQQGVEAATVASIRDELRTLLPAAAGQPLACAWSGFRPYCEDLKPVVGAVPTRENTYVAAGHFKKGIMMSPVTGKILADLITSGKTGLPIEPLSPARFPARTPASFTE